MTQPHWALRAEGWATGPDVLARLHELLLALPTDCSLPDWARPEPAEISLPHRFSRATSLPDLTLPYRFLRRCDPAFHPRCTSLPPRFTG